MAEEFSDANRPRRAAGEGGLVIRVMPEEGLGRGHATGQCNRDSVAGKACDHRGLVADPVAACFVRLGAPAVGHAGDRLRLGRPGVTLELIASE